MFKNLSITRSYLFIFTTLLIITALLFGLFWVWQEYKRFSKALQSLESTYMDSKVNLARGEVNRAFTIIDEKRKDREQMLRDEIKSRVYEAHSIASHIIATYSGTMTSGELKSLIRESLRPVRFLNGRGYYFATSLDGVEQLFADRPELEGKNLLESANPNVRKVIQDMIDLTREAGEGYYEYLWTKPGFKDSDHRKIAFIKHLDYLDWFIGTGDYLEDMESDVKIEILEMLGEIGTGRDGFIFVINSEGNLQTVTTCGGIFPENPGLDTEHCSGIIRAFRKASGTPMGGIVEYNAGAGNENIKRVAYVKSIPEWGWIVGAGMDVSDFDKIVGRNRASLKHRIRNQIVFISTVTLGGVLIAILIAVLISRRIGREFGLFTSFFQNAAVTSCEIDRDALAFREFKTLAESANRMVSEITNARKALQESEEKYRSFVERASDGIVILQNTFIVFVNPVMEKTLGYKPDELLGSPFTVFIHPEDEERVVERYRLVMTQDEPPPPTELLVRHKAGHYVIFEISGARINYNGSPAALLVARDITSRRKEEEERHNLEMQLLNARKLESLGILAGGIAHDFNNLLMGIMGNAGLIVKELGDKDVPLKRLRAIEISAARAAELTNQLLAYSGKGKFIVQPLDISELAEEMTAILETVVHKHADLKCYLAKTIPAIEGDATQLRQVVMNLITNAADAMNGRHGTVEISTGITRFETNWLRDAVVGKDLAAGEYVYLRVEDSGCGMDENTMPRIFDPFFTTKFTGRGLGLAAVLGIVRGHRGALRVESCPGVGTIFTILFPPSLKPAESSGQGNNKEDKWHAQGTILVVDDEETVREVVKEILESVGFNVLTAEDGIDALKVFREHETDIEAVILDMTMPNMAGDETFCELKKIKPDIKAIISSGYNQQDVTEQFEDGSPAGFIQKPYTATDLISVMRYVIEHSHART